jgi:hypothetical protein
MEAHDVLRARPFVKAVHVLRDERETIVSAAPGGDHLVRAIRRTAGDPAASPLVPLPHELRVARKRLGRGEVLRTEVPPEAVRSAEGRDAARRGDAGARGDGDAGGPPKAVGCETEKVGVDGQSQ